MSNLEKLVSIVLPTHNGAKYLHESIESCLQQTHTNFELLIVDDASTDTTLQIAQSYTDPRIRVIRHEQNRGLPGALNTGFSRAAGEYLTWTSDDNRYALEALAHMVNALEQQPDVGMVYADYWLIDDQGDIIREMQVGTPEMLATYSCVGGCFLYRRSVYENVGAYNPRARLAEDYEYWLRIARSFRIAPIRTCLYYYRQHASSLSGRLNWFPAARVGEKVKLDLHWIQPGQYRKRMAYIDISEAFERFQSGSRAKVPPLIWAGLRRDPTYVLNRGVWAILLKSLPQHISTRIVRGAHA